MAKAWMPFYVADYLADTGHLTTEQHGVYCLLLFHYWQKGRLPGVAQCMHVAHAYTDATRTNVEYVLKEFFIEKDGVFHQKRLDKELKKHKEITDIYRKRAKKAANARWNASSNASSIPQVMLEDAQSQSHIKNKNINNKNIKNKNIKNKNIKNKGFVPPTLEEVKAYCLERKNNVDAQKWFDHYTSNGWKVGKNSMKDWQAAIRTWERSEYGPSQNGSAGNPQSDIQPKGLDDYSDLRAKVPKV